VQIEVQADNQGDKDEKARLRLLELKRMTKIVKKNIKLKKQKTADYLEE
jgi:hypothetical protein